MNKDELVQYFIINSELNMSPGKVAVQVGHVATIITVDFLLNKEGYSADVQQWQSWYEQDQLKIVLRGKQKDLGKLADQGFYYIRDLGRTEVPPNSLTCVGLPPMTRRETQKYVKGLQLY